MHRDGFGRLLLLHVAALSTAGAVAAAAVLRRRYRRKMKELLPAPAMTEMPKVVMADTGHVEHIEKFSHYVAQIQDMDHNFFASDQEQLHLTINIIFPNPRGSRKCITNKKKNLDTSLLMDSQKLIRNLSRMEKSEGPKIPISDLDMSQKKKHEGHRSEARSEMGEEQEGPSTSSAAAAGLVAVGLLDQKVVELCMGSLPEMETAPSMEARMDGVVGCFREEVMEQAGVER